MILIKISTLKYDQKFDQNYHIYILHYSGLLETEFETKRILTFQFRFEVETKSILKFPSRIPTGRKIPSGQSVSADSLIKINLIIKLITKKKMIKKYALIVINKNTQNIKWKKNSEILKIVDEKNFNFQIVHNVDKNFKKLNSNARMLKIKKL